MASAAVAWCSGNAVTVRGGVCISHDDDNSPVGPLRVLAGDHPIPGVRSFRAASVMDEYISTSVHHGDRVLVLLSGGTSALIGAPRRGVSPEDYVACCQALLGSGLAIGPMNLLRRRLSRWGGGMMAAAFTARGAHADVLAISDVPADELAAIGGGPCVADVTETADLLDVMANAVFHDADAELLHRTLAAVAQTVPRITPQVDHHVIASNRQARDAVVRAARASGLAATDIAAPLAGDAHACGRAIADALLTAADPPSHHRAPHVFCWGGEPTVSLGSAPPRGGRMQALALAAAERLASQGGNAAQITMLAAGTDGRDGTTDAAGAVVSSTTWAALLESGLNPAALMAAHRAHDALRQIGALLPAFASGTNVNDLVLGLVRR